MKEALRSQLIQHHIWQVLAKADCWMTPEEIHQDTVDEAEYRRESLGIGIAKLPFMSAEQRFSVYPPVLMPSEVSHNMEVMLERCDFLIPVPVTSESLTELWNQRFGALDEYMRELNDFKARATFWTNGKFDPADLTDALRHGLELWKAEGQCAENYPVLHVLEHEQAFYRGEQEYGAQVRAHFTELLESNPNSPQLVVYYCGLPIPSDAEEDMVVKRGMRDELGKLGCFPPRPLPAADVLACEYDRRLAGEKPRPVLSL